jgi:hypothetical protein
MERTKQCKMEGKRAVQIFRHRWGNNIKMNHREIGRADVG